MLSKIERSSVYNMYAKLILSLIASVMLGNAISLRVNSLFFGIVVCLVLFSILYLVVHRLHYGNSGITMVDDSDNSILCIDKEDVNFIVQEIMALTNMSKESMGYKTLEKDLCDRLSYFKKVSDFNLFISRIPIYINASKYKVINDSMMAKDVLDERIDKCRSLMDDYSENGKNINDLISRWNSLVSEFECLHKDFEKWADILVEETSCINFITSRPPKAYKQLLSMPDKSSYLEKSIAACETEKGRYDSIITECSGDNKEIVNFMYAKVLSKRMINDMAEITGENNPIYEILYK